MTFWKSVALALALTSAFSVPLAAQSGHQHHDGMGRSPEAGHMMDRPETRNRPSQTGQSAFAAIAEIVAILRADPDTNWKSVNLEALRQHLVDMDNVTLRAAVSLRDVDGGASFEATSGDPAISASIGRMVTAHAATMSGVDGIQMKAEKMPGGARLTATGPDADMIRGLGFIGLMTIGMHHQAHHLALARGMDPHEH